jgi:hypothetical protein
MVIQWSDLQVEERSDEIPLCGNLHDLCRSASRLIEHPRGFAAGHDFALTRPKKSLQVNN